jgi:hypothetical protein
MELFLGIVFLSLNLEPQRLSADFMALKHYALKGKIPTSVSGCKDRVY